MVPELNRSTLLCACASSKATIINTGIWNKFSQFICVVETVNMDTSKMYNVSELLGTRIKPTNERFGLWMLLENMDNNNLITDVGNINYTLEEKLLTGVNLKPLTPLTDLFCDNIMVVKIIDKTDCEEGRLIVKKDICGAFNSYLRGKFSTLVSARHGVKAKLPFLLESKTRVAERLRNVIGSNTLENINNRFKTPVAIPYKVELADVKLNTLLQELTNILTELKLQDFYLMDLDITQDFVGIFNKKEMTEYLTSNCEFRYQGKEYKECHNTIVNNDNTVGIDCLTWITPNGARVKIYNKFVCQITSPGVNKQIGNHIVDFVNCPDSRLKQTFLSPLANEHGITRLEATIYNTNANNPVDDCVDLLENNKLYFQDAPFYSVSIPKMWTKLTDCLQNSCCFVFNNLLQYVYWGNRNTKKLTGIQITLPEDQTQRQKLINYTLSAFSFNCLPVNLIDVVEDTSDNNKVVVTQKCFIKSGDTFFSKSTTLFSTLSKYVSLENCGLVPTNNVTPQILRKRTNVNSKLLPYTVKEIEPVSLLYVLSVKKRKLELEEVDLKRRKVDFLEKTVALKEQYKHLVEKETELAEFKDRLISSFKTYWKNLDTTGVYNVSAFTVNNKGSFTYVGVLAEKEDWKDVYYLKGFHKNIFINAYANKDKLREDGYVIINNNGLDIVSLPTEKPFLTFKTNGLTTYKGNSFANIENIEFLTEVWKNVNDIAFTQEEMEQFSGISMQEIKGCVKIRLCKRLEELTEGSELLINGIKVIAHRNKNRYILQFENLENLYLSNFWLEKELENSTKDLNYKIKIKLDKIKYTPSRNKERVVFCV